jgi:hypothetical protein
MIRRVALVRTDVSEELSAFIIRVTRIGELGTLAVTSFSKRPLLQEPHCVSSRKTPFFKVTAVKTSNLSKGIYPETFRLVAQCLNGFHRGVCPVTNSHLGEIPPPKISLRTGGWVGCRTSFDSVE